MHYNNFIRYILNKRDKNKYKKLIKKETTKRLYTLDYKIADIEIPERLTKVPKKKKKNVLRNTIYYLNNTYFHDDYNFDKYEVYKGKNLQLPDGMALFKRLFSKKFNKSLFEELEATYQKYPKDSSYDFQADGNRIFLFDNLNLFEIIRYTYTLNKKLAKLLLKAITNVVLNLQFKNKKDLIHIIKNSKLVIPRYNNAQGLYTHIDNVKKSDGLVLTIPIGVDNTIYDLVSLDNTLESKRLYIKQGEPVIMDGLSRFIYAHGIPNNIQYKPQTIRFSLVFLITNYNQLDCKVDSKFFNIQICKQNNYSKY